MYSKKTTTVRSFYKLSNYNLKEIEKRLKELLKWETLFIIDAHGCTLSKWILQQYFSLDELKLKKTTQTAYNNYLHENNSRSYTNWL